MSDSVRPIDGSPPGSSIQGIFQARVLEWGAIALSVASIWDERNCVAVWAFFGIAFLWDGMKSDLFLSRVHCWIFQICWHTDCSTFTAPSFIYLFIYFYLLQRCWNPFLKNINLFILIGGQCSHEIKRRLLLGRKVMTNLDSIFGEGNGTPLQYSCLENPMDGGAW